MLKRNRSPLDCTGDECDELLLRADRKRIAKSEHQAKTSLGHKKLKRKSKKDDTAKQKGDVEPEAQVDVHDLGDGESHLKLMNNAAARSLESTPGKKSRLARDSISKQRTEPASPRTSHAAQRKMPLHGLTGFFSPEEVHAFERYKVDFCNLNGLSSKKFNEIVQHSAHDKSNFPCPPSVTTKKQFWRDIYATAPNRDRRSVYRFMRRHFQPSAQEPHKWTPEQDEELVELHELYGPRWAKIAKELGRSQDDVVQRWKNQVKHRDTMKRGPWSEEEVRLLQEALTFARNAGITAGYEVGKDIYELDESFIGWGVVSDYIRNSRSRKQCADKWRKIKRFVLRRRAKGDPNATYDPSEQVVHLGNGGSSKSGDNLRRSKPLPKSADFVTFSDDQLTNSDNGDTNSPAASRTKKTHNISGQARKAPLRAESNGDDIRTSTDESEGSTEEDGSTSAEVYSILSSSSHETSVNEHSSSQQSSKITKRESTHSASGETTEAASELSNDQESSEDEQENVFFNSRSSSSQYASTNDVRAKRQMLKESKVFPSMDNKESKLGRIPHKALSVSHSSRSSTESTSESSSDDSSSEELSLERNKTIIKSKIGEELRPNTSKPRHPSGHPKGKAQHRTPTSWVSHKSQKRYRDR